MSSITSWVRLEPRSRDRELAAGSEARIHDPLWLVARQWQLGELAGVDAGSAITARTRFAVSSMDAVRAASGDWVSFAPDQKALESALDDPSSGFADAVRDGQRLLRMLSRWPTSVALFRSRFPFQPTDVQLATLDANDRRFCASMTGRALDGSAAAAVLAPLLKAGDLPPNFGIASTDIAAVSQACRDWLASLSEAPLGAWRPDQLAYELDARVPATPPVRLAVQHHRRDSLAWHDFDASVADGPSTAVVDSVSTSLPTRVVFRGAPTRRYWDLEDSAVHWPSLAANPGDVGRVLTYHLGLTFGDGWMVVPLEVPHGSVSRIRSLVVTDTFGVRQLVPAAEDIDPPAAIGRWRFLQTARDPALAGPLITELPSSSGVIGERVLAAVDLLRDDVADVLWGIDRVVRGQDGEPRAVSPSSPPSVDTSSLAYRLGRVLPSSDHPYRARIGSTGLELVRASVPGSIDTDHPDLPATIAIHALPQRPMQLRLNVTLFRSADGRYHRIVRHDVVPIPPSATPTLMFDQLTRLPVLA